MQTIASNGPFSPSDWLTRPLESVSVPPDINAEVARETLEREIPERREGEVLVVSLDAPTYTTNDHEYFEHREGALRRIIPMRGETFVFQVRNGELLRLAPESRFYTSTVPTMSMNDRPDDQRQNLPEETQEGGPAAINNGVYEVRRQRMNRMRLDAVLFEDAQPIDSMRDHDYDGTLTQASKADGIFAHSYVSATIGCIAVFDMKDLNATLDNALGPHTAAEDGHIRWLVHRR